MDWKIDRIRDRCAACSTAFSHDQKVVSVIDLEAELRAMRRDLCEACAKRRTEEAGGLVWWETRFQQVQKRKKVDFDRLLRLFEAWHQRPPSGQDALIYLIALLLIRKRFLRMVDLVSQEGGEYLRLRKPGPTEQWYLCPAPLLTAADLPALRTRLEELIDGTFEEAEVPASADAAAAGSNAD